MKSSFVYLALIIFIAFATPAEAKRRAFFGRMVDNREATLLFGSVTSKNGSYRFGTDKNGFFYFKADEDSLVTLIFSAPGYNSQEFQVDILPEDSIIIELSKRKNVLNGVTVGSMGKNTKMETSGINRGLHHGGCYFNIYDEIAVYLPATINGMITEIGAFITRQGRPSSDFRMHIYAADSATGAPGEDITDSILVVHADKGNDWVVADLANLFIQAKVGVYVSVEWMLGNRNSYEPSIIPEGAHNYYAGNDSFRNAYNNQVLGLAWQDVQPKVYRRYANNIYLKKDIGKWYLTPPLKGGHRGREWIAPMIYMKYSYVAGR